MTGLRAHLLGLAQKDGATALPKQVDRTLHFMRAQVGKPEFMTFYRDIRASLEKSTVSAAKSAAKESPGMPPPGGPAAANVSLEVQAAPPGSARAMARDILIDTFGNPHTLVDLWGDLPPSQSLGRGLPAMGDKAFALANKFAQDNSLGNFSPKAYLNELKFNQEMQQVEERVTASIAAAGFAGEGAPAPDADELRRFVLDAFTEVSKAPSPAPSSDTVDASSASDFELGAARWDAGVDEFLESPFAQGPGQISPLAATGYIELKVLSDLSFTSIKCPHDFLAECRPNAERADMTKPDIKRQFERLMREEVAVQSATITPVPKTGSPELRRLLMNARSAALSRMQFPDSPVAPGEVSQEEVQLRLKLLDECHAHAQAIRALPGGHVEALMLKKTLDQMRDDLHGSNFPSQYASLRLQLERTQGELLLSSKSTDPYYSPHAFKSSFDALSAIARRLGGPPLRTESDVRQVRQFVHVADSYLALRVKTSGLGSRVEGPLSDAQHGSARADRQALAEAFLKQVVAVCERRGLDVRFFNQLSPAEKRVLLREAMGRWGGLAVSDAKSVTR